MVDLSAGDLVRDPKTKKVVGIKKHNAKREMHVTPDMSSRVVLIC